VQQQIAPLLGAKYVWKSSLQIRKKRKEVDWGLYLILISFEDCHNPWILHDESARIVPGLLVLNHVVTAW